MGGEKPRMADAGEGIGRGRSGKKRCRGEDGQPEKTREKRSEGGLADWLTSHRPVLREGIHSLLRADYLGHSGVWHAAPEVKTNNPEKS
jgi:hypothetical protein